MEESVKTEQENNVIVENIKDIANTIKGLDGVVRECDGVKLFVEKNGDITVIWNGGITATYSSFTESWGILLGWVCRWDDVAKNSVRSFFSYVGFPVMNITNEFDEEYIDSVVGAYVKMKERSGNTNQSESLNMASIARSIFVKLTTEENEQ